MPVKKPKKEVAKSRASEASAGMEFSEETQVAKKKKQPKAADSVKSANESFRSGFDRSTVKSSKRAQTLEEYISS